MKNTLVSKFVCYVLVVIFLANPLTAFAESSDSFNQAHTMSDENLQIEIRTVDDLKNISTELNKNYILKNDIILNEPWDAIGSKDRPYQGTFDGNGFKIKNLHFNNSYEPIGLFSSTKNATIKNLVLESVKSPSQDYSELGSVVGNASDSNFENISVLNSIIENGWSIYGGIVGIATNSKFYRCSIDDTSYVAGKVSGAIVGLIKGTSVIDQCVSNAKLSGLYVGGIVAFAENEWSIVDTYSTSEIVKKNFTNSVEAAGLILSNKNGLIKNSYYAGKVENNIIMHPLSENGVEIINSYFDSDLLGIRIPVEQARITNQMKQKSNFIGWDFDIWDIEEGNTYPYLKNLNDESEITEEVDEAEIKISANNMSLTESDFIYTTKEKISEINVEILGNFVPVEMNFKIYTGKMLLQEGDITPAKKSKIVNPIIPLGSCRIEITAIDNEQEELYNFSVIKNEGLVSDIVFDNNDNDNDKLKNYYEDVIGTDKNSSDTDRDLISDYDEICIFLTNPLIADSFDLNGDEDNDGLTLREELEYKTIHTVKDSDFDGLIDSEEVKIYNTNPLNLDSDEDGLSDFIEINQTKSDPLKKDSDSNGIIDADEYYTISGTYNLEGQTNEKIVPTFELSVLGKSVQPFEVELIPEDDIILSNDIYGYLGKAFRFNYIGGYKSLKVSAKVDSQYITTDDKPTLYAQDKENQIFVELENQTISNNIISADVDSTKKYTTFILLNKELYERTLEPFDFEGNQLEINRASITEDNLDTVILLGSTDPYLFNINKEIIIKTLDSKNLSEKNRFAIVVFGKDYFNVLSDFTNDRELLKRKINNLYCWNLKRLEWPIGLESPIEKVFSTMLQEGNQQKNIFLFLDSFEVYFGKIKDLSKLCNRYNTQITLISEDIMWDEMKYYNYFNSNIGTGRTVSYSSSPRYYMDHSSFGVTKENANIELIRYLKKTDLDSDGDKLTDFMESGINIGGVTIYGKKIIKTPLDIYNKDTDGDGLIDGDEIVLGMTVLNKVKVKSAKSDPTLADTDGDGYKDGVDPYPFVKIMDRPTKISSERVDDMFELTGNSMITPKYNSNFIKVQDKADTSFSSKNIDYVYNIKELRHAHLDFIKIFYGFFTFETFDKVEGLIELSNKYDTLEKRYMVKKDLKPSDPKSKDVALTASESKEIIDEYLKITDEFYKFHVENSYLTPLFPNIASALKGALFNRNQDFVRNINVVDALDDNLDLFYDFYDDYTHDYLHSTESMESIKNFSPGNDFQKNLTKNILYLKEYAEYKLRTNGTINVSTNPNVYFKGSTLTDNFAKKPEGLFEKVLSFVIVMGNVSLVLGRNIDYAFSIGSCGVIMSAEIKKFDDFYRMTVEYKLVDFLDSDYASGTLASQTPDSRMALAHEFGVARFHEASGSVLAFYEWKEGCWPKLTNYKRL